MSDNKRIHHFWNRNLSMKAENAKWYKSCLESCTSLQEISNSCMCCKALHAVGTLSQTLRTKMSAMLTISSPRSLSETHTYLFRSHIWFRLLYLSVAGTHNQIVGTKQLQNKRYRLYSINLFWWTVEQYISWAEDQWRVGYECKL